MSKVLLINPPVPQKDYLVRGAKEVGSILPPLGLAYIAAILEKYGHKVKIIDGIVEKLSLQEIVQTANDFDIVGLTSITTLMYSLNQTLEALKDIKATIVVGGPHATATPSTLIQNKIIDYLVIGEGECTFLELVNALEKKKGVQKIKGLMYRIQSKNKIQIKFTGNRPFIKNLDDLPLPARHLLPMHKYKSSEARSVLQPSLSMISSRGCPFNCTFCNKKIFGQTFRAHSPERVVQEMKILRDEYGAKDIAIWDDNFTVDKKRVHKICDLLKKEDFDVSWSCEARVDCVDLPVLEKMASTGCRFIAYGVESGNDKVLKSIRKGFNKDWVRQTFRWTKQAQIPIRAYFIMGLIGESQREMQDTIDFAKELNPEVASFTYFVPLPGTDAYDIALKKGTFLANYWEEQNIPEFHFLEKLIYVPEGLNASQLRRMHKKAFYAFYFRLNYLSQQLSSIKSFKDIYWLFKGVKTLLKI